MHMSVRAFGIVSPCGAALIGQALLENDGDVFVDRTGMRLFLLHAQLRQ